MLGPADGPENTRSVAEGDADFCLTSVNHYLRARDQWGDLPARFAAVVVRRSPMAAHVAADSGITAVADLAGRRVAGADDSGLAREYEGALAALGLPPSVLVPLPYGDWAPALGRGDIEVLPDFADLLPRVRRQAGIEVRAVPLGHEVYASGLVAADRVPDDVVAAVRDALVQALERQRLDPKAGVDELARRWPDVEVGDAPEGWSLVEPNIFTGATVGSMDRAGWERTLAHAAATHGLSPVAPETVYREVAGA